MMALPPLNVLRLHRLLAVKLSLQLDPRLTFGGQTLLQLGNSCPPVNNLRTGRNCCLAVTLFDNIQIPVLTIFNRSRKLLRSIFKEKGVQAEVNRILAMIGLVSEAQTPASALSHGDQRVLEVGIALAARPKLLFLDEPTAGMNPVERVKILDNIRRLSAIGKTTFVIVEHDMDVVFSLSERVIVLHHGAVIGDGSTEDVQANPRVREVYLGEEVAL